MILVFVVARDIYVTVVVPIKQTIKAQYYGLQSPFLWSIHTAISPSVSQSLHTSVKLIPSSVLCGLVGAEQLHD